MLLGCSACVFFNERQHIEAIGKNGRNYYRISVEGFSFLSASQYASGWYDEEAVDTLFGELKGEGKLVSVDDTSLAGHAKRAGAKGAEQGGATPGADSSTPEGLGGGPDKLSAIGGDSLEGRRFVMFLSTNSDSLVNQIASLTASAEVSQSVGALLMQKDVERLQVGRNLREKSNATSIRLADAIEQAGKDLGGADSVTAQAVTDRLLRLIRMLAASSSDPESSQSIDTVEKATQWLIEHPSAFAPE